MNKLIISILLAIFAIPSFGQSISIFDIDTTNFPTMKAKFYAFDKDGKQVTPNISDLKLTENGISRKITNVSCPVPKLPKPISSVLVIDVSGSMNANLLGTSNMDIAKSAANAWVNTIDLSQSECAITSFDNKNYLNHDFTSDRNRLLNSIAPLNPQNGTDYDAALLLPLAGGLQVSKNGIHKKVIVLITDGAGGGTEDKIIEEANKQNCTIYCVTIKMKAPEILKNISSQTGGQYFENVKSVEEVNDIYTRILRIAQSEKLENCNIEWLSDYNCVLNEINLFLEFQNKKSISKYSPSNYSQPILDINPQVVLYGERIPNGLYDTTITLKAVNYDFIINDIKIKYGTTNFQIINETFPLIVSKDSIKKFILRYNPNDSSINYASFDIITDKCIANFSTSGGYPGKPNKIQTLKLLKPNGGEEFIVGSDTIITWEGVSPKDTLTIEYSLDSGRNWKLITRTATGLNYKWKNIPMPKSNRCLIKIRQEGKVLIPNLEWSKTYGCDNIDFGMSIDQDYNNNFIVAGLNSFDSGDDISSGDVSNGKGEDDCWVFKTNNFGELIWEKSLGGSKDDKGYSIIKTQDNGYLVVGNTKSNDIDTSKIIQESEIFLIKLDNIGNILWKKIYGGNNIDEAFQVKETKDNGFVIVGSSFSTNIDIKKSKFWNDLYVIKVNSDGIREWVYTKDYRNENIGYSIDETMDNGFIIGGTINEPDSNKINGYDCLIVKINSKGIFEWEKVFSGNSDEYCSSIKQTFDGGYIITGDTKSNDGFANYNNGSNDLYIAKLNSLGEIEWIRNIGGSQYDVGRSITLTNDYGYILCGYTQSNDKDIKNNKGKSDALIIKLNEKGDVEWQSLFGGSDYDDLNEIKQLIDGSYIAVGSTSSNDGDLINNKRYLHDVWLLKLSPDRQILQQDISDTLFSIVAPSPASNDIDMKKCVVGRAKDSIINNFIVNKDKYPFGVDSIYFSGADVGAFSLVSGLPKYNVLGNSNEFAEIRFIPNRVGLHSAIVNIITTYDTLVQNIVGEGVASGIEVINNFIDFGNVSLGKFKDSLQAVTIRNISLSDILITNIKQSGPNFSDFLILSNTTNLLLKAGDTLRLDIKYTPSFDGKVNGSLSFEFNEIGSPAYVQLYGRGIDAKAILSADSSSAFMRKEAKVILRLTNMDKLIDVGNTHISAELVYNKTMLYPKTIMNRYVEGDSVVIKLDSLPLVANANNLLKELKFTATLGNAEETSLNLRNVKIIGADANITVVNGNFKLLGVCYEGGERFLVGNKSKTMLLSISPNPATESIEIEYSNADEGEAEIIISNLLGQNILTQKLEKTQTGFAKLDLSQIPTGQFSILFKTETVLENRMIQVIK